MADHDPDSTAIQRYTQLISLAVHELRTPASVVGGYLRMLQRDTEHPLNERQRKMVDEASRSCERLVDLVSELGEVGRLDDGRMALQRDRFDLFALLEEVAASTQEGADRQVSLTLRGPKAGAPIVGDRTRIRSAFASLCRAVLREQPDSSVVVLDRQASRGSGPSALIVIACEDELEHTRSALPASFDEKRSGLGLALPIARRVIECHGGRVWSPAAAEGGTLARTGIVVSLPLTE